MFVVYGLLAYLVLMLVVTAFIVRPWTAADARLPGERRTAAAPRPVAPLLHAASLRNWPIRYYRSPLDGPDFPWIVLRDLFRMATDGADYSVSSELIYAAQPDTAQAIVTERGVELVLCFGAASALLATLLPGEAAPAMQHALKETMAEAYVLQHSDLTRDQFLALCAAASARDAMR